jgi:hypothetical protein
MTQPATTQTQSVTNEPQGRYFHAPQVRLLIDDSGEGTDPIVLPPTSDANGVSHPVHADIERAEVTQVHNGPSQASITFNNQRHEDTSRPRQVAPSWKYNGFDPLRFGQRILVQFGYAIGSHEGDQARTQQALMLRARVTDMQYVFPMEGGAKLTLKAEDLLSLLKVKPTADEPYRDKDEAFMVGDALRRSGCGLSLAPATRNEVTGTIRRLTHRKSQSYYEFIEEFAKRLDYEVWVDIDQPSLMHFEQARSLTFGTCIDLIWGRDLIDFKPKFKGWDINTKAEAGGSTTGRRARIRELIDENQTMTEISRDLHRADGGLAPMNAVDARSTYFADEGVPTDNPVNIDTRNLNRSRVTQKAKAALRKSARQFLTAEATVIGMPTLRPGIHVNLQRLNVPFDGIYYVTKAVHTIDNTGYKTKISLRRPGMLFPSDYPHRQEAPS